MPVEEITKIEPDRLSQYLRDKGWEKQREHPDKCFAIWIYFSKNGRTSLLLPSDKEMPGYIPKLWEAVKAIAFHENRQPLEIIEGLSNG